jgi:hypothetical protein
MPSTGAAKAKAKSTPAAPPTVVVITDGIPNNKIAYVNVEGTVQFDNHDTTDYRIRLWAKKRARHPLIDVLLPAVDSVTLMADPLAKQDDDCEYDLVQTDLQHPARGEKTASGGGGKIIIGPTPSPKKGRRSSKNDPFSTRARCAAPRRGGVCSCVCDGGGFREPCIVEARNHTRKYRQRGGLRLTSATWGSARGALRTNVLEIASDLNRNGLRAEK